MSSDLGIIPKPGRGKKLSLNLKSSNDTYNFGSIQENGEVWFYGIVTKTGELGNRQIGIDYLTKVAAAINGEFDTNYKEWFWCVKKNGNYIKITNYLKIKTEWKNIISETLDIISKLEEEA